jgi:hypothetical protein
VPSLGFDAEEPIFRDARLGLVDVNRVLLTATPVRRFGLRGWEWRQTGHGEQEVVRGIEEVQVGVDRSVSENPQKRCPSGTVPPLMSCVPCPNLLGNSPGLDPRLSTEHGSRWRFCPIEHAGHRVALMTERATGPELQVWEARPLLAPPSRLAASGELWFPTSPVSSRVLQQQSGHEAH